jgi:hypothetical protein
MDGFVTVDLPLNTTWRFCKHAQLTNLWKWQGFLGFSERPIVVSPGKGEYSQLKDNL